MLFEYPGPRGLSAVQAVPNSAVVLFGEVLADVFPDRTVLGGAPFNVARHLKAFGRNPVLITRLGNDELGDEVMRTMEQSGMSTVGVQTDKSHRTGKVEVRLENGAHRFEILPARAYDYIHPVIARMAALSVHPVMSYFGTLAQRSETSNRSLRGILKISGVTRFLDVNLREPWYDKRVLRQSLEYAEIVKVNECELGVLSGMFDLNETDRNAQAAQLIRHFNIEQLLVTRGDEGAVSYDQNGAVVERPVATRSVAMVDTVGAGDAFSAVCLLGALCHWPITIIMERANDFAAAICGVRGAVPDHAEFYEPFLAAWKC